MALPRVRGAALLAIAALVGLIVSLVLIYTVERLAAVTTVPVLVVTKSVAKGTTLQANMVEVVQWPAHLKSFEALKAPEAALGRLTRVDLYDGEPLLDGKLRRRGERGDLNDQLGVGERALSVRVNDILGVAVENILGQNVDLLLTRRTGDSPASSVPVAERVRVLAVNDTGSADRPQPIRMLTLAVTPEQAASIERARSEGTLTVLVRNPRDARLSPRAVVSSREETVSASPPRPRATPEPPVELIIGSETVTP